MLTALAGYSTGGVASSEVRFSTVDADVRLGDARVTLLEGARYHIIGAARAEDGSGERVTLA